MKSGEYKKYIWQKNEWPHWELHAQADVLSQINMERGRLLGAMQGLGFQLIEEATLATLTREVVKSSEIEGEMLNSDLVRSSLARRLGIEQGGLLDTRNVDGIVEVVLDATQNYMSELTDERLYAWHAALFPTGRSGMYKINVGAYRTDADGPMQIVSGGYGREKVHYEAPPAVNLIKEMNRFLAWFNSPGKIDPLVKAGLAHFWFVTLHPFEDGNGRIGRAICDMALAQADGTPQRFYSLSSQMMCEREAYYHALEISQKGSLNIDDWITWFLGCLLRAIQGADSHLQGVKLKANFWRQWPAATMNERQVKILNMLLDEFSGNLTNRKWAQINKCSSDTALRDIKELVDRRVLIHAGAGGRSTHYLLQP